MATNILAIQDAPDANTQMVMDMGISCVRVSCYLAFIVITTSGLAGLVIQNTGEDGGSLSKEMDLMCPGFSRDVIPCQEAIEEMSHMWIQREVSCLMHGGQLALHDGISLQLWILHFPSDWFKQVWGE